MSSRTRILLLVAAAFAVGVLSAPIFGLPGKDLRWKKDGQIVRLTAGAKGAAYLILSAGDSASPVKTVNGATVELAAPATVYRLVSELRCIPPVCNDCDDCPVPKPPPPPTHLQGILWERLPPLAH